MTSLIRPRCKIQETLAMLRASTNLKVTSSSSEQVPSKREWGSQVHAHSDFQLNKLATPSTAVAGEPGLYLL